MKAALKIFAALLIGSLLTPRPVPGQVAPAEPDAASAMAELNRAVADAGNSSVDLIRALEGYLQKYPDTKQRPLIEKSLARSAVEANDGPRILLYGEKLLQTPPDDVPLLDRVIRQLLESNDAESAKRALAYGKRYEADIEAMRTQPPAKHLTAGQWTEQLQRARARAFALESHALGMTGAFAEAEKAAQKSWAEYPTGEGAREAANWLVRLGRKNEAISSYADAFTLEDPGSTAADRARDRVRMGSLYAEANGSEKGLGDVILRAYDRTAGLLSDRVDRLKAADPNAAAIEILDFTLPSLDGSPPLALSTLKGKTVVFDFWATWCNPCRAQHPLIENVKARYQKDADVAFVAVNADDDTSLVVPFLKEQGWRGPVWFEDGMERRLAISSLPTVIVVDPAGGLSSRMAGFNPARFEETLIRHIEEAKRSPAAK